MPNLIEIIRGLWTSDPVIIQWYIDHGRVILDYMHGIFDSFFYAFLYVAVVFTVIYLTMSAFVLINRKTRPEPQLDLKKAPFVTVQIPTKNEVVALRCAERCLEFDYPKDRFEIIIGDDSDKPEVSMKIDEFANLHRSIKVIRRQDKSGFKPGNLNSMLKHSKGEYIVIFDSDFTPDKDFLRRIIAPMVNDSTISAVQARWNFNNFRQNRTTVLASTIVYVFHHIVLTFMDKFNTSSLCGSAEAIRKKTLIELGGWKVGSLTEDIEFSLRLYKDDRRIVYLKDLVCFSDVPHLAKDLYKQQMRWGYGVISAYKTHLFGLLFNRKTTTKKKVMSLNAGFGYLMPVLIMAMFFTGVLSFVTDKPGPIDLPRFLSETSRNILLTSGLLMASLIALQREHKLKYAFRMLYGSFSIGLVTTYYVNKGIFKSITNKPMEWYLLNKNNNFINS